MQKMISYNGKNSKTDPFYNIGMLILTVKTEESYKSE